VPLPLVAEFATAQRCSGTPDEPEHATVRCFRKKGTCRATCQGSYIFSQKNAKTAIYDCEGGNWVMRGGEDRCTPECDPPCENGECIEPGVCDCDDGFTGDYCEDEEELEEEEEYEEHYTTEAPTEAPDAYEDDEEEEYGDDYENEDHTEYEEDGEEHDESTDEPAVEDEDVEAEDDHEDDDHDHDGDGEQDHDHDVHADHGELDGTEDEDVADNGDDVEGEVEAAEAETVDDDGETAAAETVDDDADDAVDDDSDDAAPQEAAYGGVSEVVPKILVGSAALLIVRAL